jgi:hypothetical protein
MINSDTAGTQNAMAVAQALSVAQLAGSASRTTVGALQAQSAAVAGRQWQRAFQRAVRKGRQSGRLDSHLNQVRCEVFHLAPAAAGAMVAVLAQDHLSSADFALLTWSWAAVGLPLPSMRSASVVPASGRGRAGGMW